MTWPAIWHVIAQLGSTLLLVGVGYLAGRWQHHRHQDRVEADAWDDGFTEALRVVCGFDPDAALLVDEDFPGQLDAAVDQTTSPPAHPWMN